MINHFFFAYSGNKRNECELLVDNYISNDKNIINIIEPFCGSSAISFKIWLNDKDKYHYYLNDNDKKLIEIYKLFKTEPIEKINEELQNINNKISNKEEWNNYFKTGEENIYKELFFRKYSQFGRIGFYPLNRANNKYKLNKIQIQFIEFIKSPYVHISNNDWFNVFDEYKNDSKSCFIFDPPYINSNNDFYTNRTLNVYEYFYNNKIENFECKIYLILEDIWVIKLLFQNNKIMDTYGKKYELSKRKTNHIIIYNHL